MKKIYLIHSRTLNYKEEIYEPLKNSELLKSYKFILPHEKDEEDEQINSKNIIKEECDVIVAEVSRPSIGLGIELGWAEVYGKPIICLYKKGSKVTNSLRHISDKFIEYSGSDEMIEKIEENLRALRNI